MYLQAYHPKLSYRTSHIRKGGFDYSPSFNLSPSFLLLIFNLLLPPLISFDNREQQRQSTGKCAIRQVSAILWSSINLLKKTKPDCVWRVGYIFCGRLSWTLSSKGAGFCHLLQEGVQAYWEDIKVIKDRVLGSWDAKFFCGFSRDSLAFKSAGRAWTQHFCQSWGRWAPQNSLPCFASPDLCPSCTFGWEPACGPFYIPGQEGASMCCDLNIHGTRLCRTLQVAPSPAPGYSLRPALQSWLWHSHCTRASQWLPGTLDKLLSTYSCFYINT